jgi:GNAT superfamily N-acetyltransferase
VIRAARAEDADALARVHVLSWQHAYADFVDLEAMPGVPERAAAWSAILDVGDSEVAVLEEEGRLVGFVAFGPSRDGERGLGEVYAIYVEPAAQGAGAGSALLAHAVARLRATGHASAVLWAFEDNGLAGAFYLRHGWTTDGGRREHRLAPVVRYRLGL